MRRIRIKSTLLNPAGRNRNHERGVALITTLLLLMLLTGMALAMVWSTRSDMLTNGFYRNFRGSFYAADSGVNIVREAMLNQFVPVTDNPPGALPDPTKFVAGQQPIPNGTEKTIVNNVNAVYGNYNAVTGSGTGNASGSWPERFILKAMTLTPTGCQWTAIAPAVGNGLCTAPPKFGAKFTYTYAYSITVQGQSRGTENTVLSDNGQVTIVSNTSQQNIIKNFAAYGMFIDQYALCSGTLVPGTITGPVFTNGSWNFGTSGKYTFTDPVGQAGADAGYENGGCTSVAGPSGAGISPTFKQGFNLSQAKVPLPQDSYNQERAVLDGIGTSNTPVTNTDLNSTLRDVNRNPYPSGGTSSGVFLPYTSTTVGGKTVNTFKGGGIFVQGDANVILTPAATCTPASCAQTYKITQGSTTTIVTVDSAANQTTIQQGVSGTPTVITGVPDQFDPSNGSLVGPDTMLYVNGNITSLSGPGQGQPAIQNATALTITAASNVTVTGDILYKQEPVYLSGSNVDQLTGNDTGQCLGIFTAGGNIDMHNSQSNGNLEIDASLAMISQGGSGGLTNTGSQINTLTIVGGRIQNTIQNINTTTRNVLFDRRFANGFAPPWFPSTTLAPNGVNNSPFNTPILARLSWQNQTTY